MHFSKSGHGTSPIVSPNPECAAPKNKDIGGNWSRADLEPLLQLILDAVKRETFKPDPLIPLQIEPSREVFERVKLQWLETKTQK